VGSVTRRKPATVAAVAESFRNDRREDISTFEAINETSIS
jgi:hypothetical protein